jgi:hypothetical protein
MVGMPFGVVTLLLLGTSGSPFAGREALPPSPSPPAIGPRHRVPARPADHAGSRLRACFEEDDPSPRPHKSAAPADGGARPPAPLWAKRVARAASDLPPRVPLVYALCRLLL